MASKRKSKVEREAHLQRLAAWRTTTTQYRQRHRVFVMEHLPSMDDAHWKEYTTWVADFGHMIDGGHKFNHQLKGYRRKQLAEMINISIRARELLK